MMEKKICSLYRVPYGIRAFMLSNLRYLSDKGGYDCTIICNQDDPLTKEELGNFKYIPFEVKRGNVSPWEVLKCTYKLYKIFNQTCKTMDVIADLLP